MYKENFFSTEQSFCLPCAFVLWILSGNATSQSNAYLQVKLLCIDDGAVRQALSLCLYSEEESEDRGISTESTSCIFRKQTAYRKHLHLSCAAVLWSSSFKTVLITLHSSSTLAVATPALCRSLCAACVLIPSSACNHTPQFLGRNLLTSADASLLKGKLSCVKLSFVPGPAAPAPTCMCCLLDHAKLWHLHSANTHLSMSQTPVLCKIQPCEVLWSTELD